MEIQGIKDKLKKGEFEVSLHAFEEAVDDYLSLNDVINAILLNGEVIEENPKKCRCLVYCKAGLQHVHVVFDNYEVANLISNKIEIITIYKPDPALWINNRKRRK